MQGTHQRGLFLWTTLGIKTVCGHGKHTVTKYRGQPLLVLRDRENASENNDRA